MSDTDTVYGNLVGQRVEYRGHKATVMEADEESGLRESYWCLKFDDGDACSGAWDGEGRDRHMGPGMFYYVFKGSTNLFPLPEATQEASSGPFGAPETYALRQSIATLQNVITRMQDDVATIGEHLKKTAERHEWCGEYEEHLGKLLDDLSEHTADTLKAAASRKKTYDVTFTYTITVTAEDEEEAEELASSYAEFSDGEWSVEEADC